MQTMCLHFYPPTRDLIDGPGSNDQTKTHLNQRVVHKQTNSYSTSKCKLQMII